MTVKSTNIHFVNADGKEDETQFDTHDDRELAELWWDFCMDEEIIIGIEKGITDWETGEML